MVTEPMVFSRRRALAADCRHQQGSVMVEYVVICTILVLALGLSLGEDSVLRQLLEAFRLGYSKIAFSYSLP